MKNIFIFLALVFASITTAHAVETLTAKDMRFVVAGEEMGIFKGKKRIETCYQEFDEVSLDNRGDEYRGIGYECDSGKLVMKKIYSGVPIHTQIIVANDEDDLDADVYMFNTIVGIAKFFGKFKLGEEIKAMEKEGY